MLRQGLTDRALHRLVLQNQSFRHFSFERECRRNRSRANPDRENVFIAGMARSGSTALLNALYASEQFAATTYRLMPFVLAPSMADSMARFSRKHSEIVERAHGDGLKIGAESPEALDGIFWSTYLPIPPRAVELRNVPKSILLKYAQFIENLLVHESRDRYLGKMNQGIDKLDSLSGYFHRSVFLVPFRDPLQQTASLLRQHRRFSQLSAYEKRYFGWQEHYEFGALHRGFIHQTRSIDWHTLNYWLQQWRLTYSYLYELVSQRKNLIPIAYEALAESPAPWQQLAAKLNLQLNPESFVDRNRDEAYDDALFDQNLLEDCIVLYTRLGEKSQRRLCSPA